MAAQQRLECIEHVSLCQHIRQYPRATASSQEEVFQMKVKQYRPVDYETKPGDVTILAAPAMSCPKEVYEPLWESLYDSSLRMGVRLGSIWSIDYSNQGASGVVNEYGLGDEASFFDWSRDLLLMVNQFRDFMPRPIIGLGHSVGAVVMLKLALLHPRLLTNLVLIEPALFPSMEGLTFSTVFPMTFRKDTWPSKETAMRALLKSTVYANWCPRSLQLLSQYGLRDLPTALYPEGSAPIQRGDTVTLTSTKHQDVATYARRAFPKERDGDLHAHVPSEVDDDDPDLKWLRQSGVAFYRPEGPITFAELPKVRPACLYMYGGKSDWEVTSGPEGRRLKRERTGAGIGGSGGVTAGRVADSIVAGGGHYVPLEQPEAVAEEIAKYLATETQRLSKLEEGSLQRQRLVPQGKRSSVDDDWLWWARNQYAGKKLGLRSDRPKPKI